jgi:hypothetical protein
MRSYLTAILASMLSGVTYRRILGLGRERT